MSFEAAMNNVSTRLASLTPEERAALVMQLKRKTQRAGCATLICSAAIMVSSSA